jgi:2-haloalkanoic acid dehalogenase type II
MIKVIAFDVFGTVFDLTAANRADVKAYVDHVHADDWAPLTLPPSWYELKAHDDAKYGLKWLREDYQVVTCSNGPIELLTKLSKKNGLSWDMMIPLEMAKVYKPKLEAYQLICSLMGVKPCEVAMVTANKTFGDLEAAMHLGMLPILIRDKSAERFIPDLMELARIMEHE